MMSAYISDHWRGQHSLARSLVVNTIALNVGMVTVFSYLTSWIEVNWTVPNNALLICLILFWIVVLCWQAVGAFRAASVRIQNFGSASHYYCVFAVILACAFFTLASVATQYGDKIDYVQQGVDEYQVPESTFNISRTGSNNLLLSGDIGYGATKKLASLIEQHPQSTLLLLNSDGGLIVEARGLANLIKKHHLDTRVLHRCYSACTIAFIAGNERSLAENALLGFHQYNLDSKSPMPWISPSEEQAKDLRYFQEKNIPDWFMEQAYSTPHSTIWTPARSTLLSAGVITVHSDFVE